MPAWMSDARSRVRTNGEAVRRNGRGAFNHKTAGRVIEAKEIQLGAWRRVEHIGKGHRRGRGESGNTRRLHSDIEGVLEQTGRQHISHEFRRNHANADLS